MDVAQRYFKTRFGGAFKAESLEFMRSKMSGESVDLIVTSPPFCLCSPKEYGNKPENDYLQWLRDFAFEFHRILKNSGSLIIDLGGSWTRGLPVKNLYQFKILIMLCEEFNFYLAQDFYWWNPSKLPTPAEWVTIRRVRVKDSINTIWWLSKTPYPKVSNRRVLIPYSKGQMALMENGYNPKKRPSGHDISRTFQNDNKGSIPPNLIALANTGSQDAYFRYCEKLGIKPHPARFPVEIPSFFIRMLTDKGDMVLDPFAGSCTTGEAAEILERRWVCCDNVEKYLDGAKGRFGKNWIAQQRARLLSDENPKRSHYEIPSPCLNLVNEEESALQEDGGETPRKKARQNTRREKFE